MAHKKFVPSQPLTADQKLDRLIELCATPGVLPSKGKVEVKAEA